MVFYGRDISQKDDVRTREQRVQLFPQPGGISHFSHFLLLPHLEQAAHLPSNKSSSTLFLAVKARLGLFFPHNISLYTHCYHLFFNLYALPHPVPFLWIRLIRSSAAFSSVRSRPLNEPTRLQPPWCMNADAPAEWLNVSSRAAERSSSSKLRSDWSAPRSDCGKLQIIRRVLPGKVYAFLISFFFQSKLSSVGVIISPAKEKLRKDWKSYLHLAFKALNSLCIFISPQIKKVKPSDFMRADTQVTTHILPVRG